MKSAFHVIIVVSAFAVIFGCSEKYPEGILTPQQMEEVLVDVHLSEGLMETESSVFTRPADKEAAMRSVLHKHGVTGVEFDSSLAWYGRNLETYVKVYDRVINRLYMQNERIKELIEKEQMQTLTLSGDTVDIWKGGRSFVFSSQISSNILTFNVAVDENFQKRDKFRLGMRFRMLPEDMQVYPRVTLSILDNNNEVRTKSKTIVDEGWVELELESHPEIFFSKVFGSLYLPMHQLNDRQAIYVDSIRLMRIHQPK